MPTLVHRVQVLLTDEQHRLLLKLAKAQRKPLSVLLREGVVEQVRSRYEIWTPTSFGLVERHGEAITTRDAVHAATMLNNGLTRLRSADTHFTVIAGITRVDPRKVTRR